MNIEHYKKLGYKVKCGQKITILVDNLSPQSNKVVRVKCDVCGNEKDLKYQIYQLSIKNGGYYACCSKCAYDKNVSTYLNKYGCDHPLKLKEIQEKSKQTCLEKYGVENVAQSDYFKDKYKETMLERYGVENGFQSEEIKEKIKITSIEKYGFEHYRQNNEMKNKYCRGENSNFYIHGNYKDRCDEWCTSEAKNFKRIIFSKSRSCKCCGEEMRRMQIHHLYSRNTHPELIFNVDNVVVLCECCHKRFHDEYGYGNNTKEQFEQFLKELN